MTPNSIAEKIVTELGDGRHIYLILVLYNLQYFNSQVNFLNRVSVIIKRFKVKFSSISLYLKSVN